MLARCDLYESFQDHPETNLQTQPRKKLPLEDHVNKSLEDIFGQSRIDTMYVVRGLILPFIFDRNIVIHLIIVIFLFFEYNIKMNSQFNTFIYYIVIH